MNQDETLSQHRVEQLRRAFDSAFSESLRWEDQNLEELIAIRVGPDPYAIRAMEISGLFVDPVLTALPGSMPALLGIASFRRRIAPVYDLRQLLGAAGEGEPRWLVLSADGAVGLAFDEFEGQARVLAETMRSRAAYGSAETGEPEAVEIEGVMRTIIRVPALIEMIGTQIQVDVSGGSGQ